MTGCSLGADDNPNSTHEEAVRPAADRPSADRPLIPGEEARAEVRPSEEAVPNSEDQSDDPADIEITRSIREAVVADESLSPEAKNVVIVTRDAHVTLRGDAMTVAESATIARLAVGAPGVREVDNLVVTR